MVCNARDSLRIQYLYKFYSTAKLKFNEHFVFFSHFLFCFKGVHTQRKSQKRSNENRSVIKKSHRNAQQRKIKKQYYSERHSKINTYEHLINCAILWLKKQTHRSCQLEFMFMRSRYNKLQ